MAGVASVAALPLAIYLTRFSDTFDLLHAGFAIPAAAGLGLASLALARKARMRGAMVLGEGGGSIGVARVGRVLGIIGLCLAAAGVVALGVYALLEFAGSRE